MDIDGLDDVVDETVGDDEPAYCNDEINRLCGSNGYTPLFVANIQMGDVFVLKVN